MLPVHVCPFLLKLALSVRPMVCPVPQGYAVPMGRVAIFATALAVALVTAGCGGEEDDAVAEGNQAGVGGVEYTVTLSRPLNPREEPDDAYYRGEPPPQGRILIGVFLTACNSTGAERTTTDDLLLVDNPFETRFEPKQAEPDNPFAYRSADLGPDECLPAPGGAAEETAGGSVVVFEVPTDVLENRPLQLVVDERAGEARVEGAKRITLDL